MEIVNAKAATLTNCEVSLEQLAFVDVLKIVVNRPGVAGAVLQIVLKVNKKVVGLLGGWGKKLMNRKSKKKCIL